MNGGHYEGHQRGWCPRCHAIDKMMNRLPPGDLARGISKLNKKIRANPDSAPTLLARGMLHSKLGDDRRAVKDFSRAIKLLPRCADALHMRAVCRAGLGDHHLAKEDYDAIIRLDPHAAVAYDSRGVCLMNLGEPDRAMEDYHTAIGLDPSDAIPYFNQASVHAEKGDLWRAVEDLNKAIALDTHAQDARDRGGNGPGDRGSAGVRPGGPSEGASREGQGSGWAAGPTWSGGERTWRSSRPRWSR